MYKLVWKEKLCFGRDVLEEGSIYEGLVRFSKGWKIKRKEEEEMNEFGLFKLVRICELFLERMGLMYVS